MAVGVLGGAMPMKAEAVALRKGAIGIWDSTVIAISSTAPAYSLASSMSAMVIAVGFTSPLVVLLSFLPVLGIAIAFSYMNRVNPNCGTSFLWVSESLHPAAGFISAWSSLAAGVLFMVQASSLGGTYTLNMLGGLGWFGATPDAVNNSVLVAVVGSCWFALVTFMVVYGITAAARFQRILLALEYLIVVAFSIIALVKVYGANPPKGTRHVSADWFSLGHIGGASAFAAGALVAVFFFWGWDTAANINEESENATVNPGRAGIYSMFALLALFLLGVTALQAVLSADTINANQNDVLAVFAKTLAPKPWNYLITLAVLSSTVATLQTTLLPAARVSLSMAREKVFPGFFATIHPRLLTPWIGTLFLALLAFIGLAVGVKSPNVNTFLYNSVLQVAVLVALYYGLTGIGCTWYFRRALFRNLKTFLLVGIFALVGGVFMLYMGGYSVYTTISSSSSGWSTEAPVLVALGLGVPLLILAWISNPSFFQQPTRAYDPASELI